MDILAPLIIISNLSSKFCAVTVDIPEVRSIDGCGHGRAIWSQSSEIVFGVGGNSRGCASCTVSGETMFRVSGSGRGRVISSYSSETVFGVFGSGRVACDCLEIEICETVANCTWVLSME